VVAILCGWVQREQNDVIAFLREENRILKARLKGRLRFRAKGGGREETESEWRTRTSQNGRYVDQTANASYPPCGLVDCRTSRRRLGQEDFMFGCYFCFWSLIAWAEGFGASLDPSQNGTVSY